MKRCLNYGLCCLGILAMMYMAFMLPSFMSHISGTWSNFTAQAENGINSFRTGYWVHEEEIVLPELMKEDKEIIQELQTEVPIEMEGNNDAGSTIAAE